MTVGERDASDPDDAPTAADGTEREGRVTGRTDDDAGTDATLDALSAAWHSGATDDAATLTDATSDSPSEPSNDPVVDPNEPRLGVTAARSDTVGEVAPRATQTGAAAAMYRSRDDRNRSVYRRANPWYRRLARGLIATSLLSAAAIGIYFGARAIQDFLDRDEIPAAGPEVPPIRQTSVLLTSTAAQIPLQGTLTFDVDTGAYEFVGLAGSPNATDSLTSPGDGQVFAQNADGLWVPADPSAPVVVAIDSAIAYLRDDTTADAILTNRLRRGYIDLIDQVDEGESDEGDDANVRTRYELALDLGAFADAFPLQWQDFQATALPGTDDINNHVVTLWLDDQDVLVGVDDPNTGWSWERLAYSSTPFEALVPPADQVVDPTTSAQIIDVECTVTGVSFTTALATCDAALETGRAFAVQSGLADQVASPAAELAVATVCSTLQGDDPRTFDNDGYLTLAGLLVDAGVCPGDTTLVQVGG